MPPRVSQSSRGGRGGDRGGGARGGRGGGGRGGGRGGATGGVGLAPSLPGGQVETIGVKRPGYGSAGRPIGVFTNNFEVDIPEAMIYHYDGYSTFLPFKRYAVVISPSEKTLPARLNMEIIKRLQEDVAPAIFTPPAVYDGRKNMFAPRLLPFEDGKPNQDFKVHLNDPTATANKDPTSKSKGYTVKLTKVAEINPIVLKRFIEGQQSHDNNVLTAITALNVVVRMEPTMKYPFNVRSFFTNKETKDIGSGIVLWRGYFQSVRPGIGKMLINIDISTGTMYKPGSILMLCLDFLGRGMDNPNLLAPKKGFPDRERIRLQRFVQGVRIVTNHVGESGQVNRTPRVVKKLSAAGANDLSFPLREGGTQTVAEYFRRIQNNRPLRYPDVICVEVGSGALIPLELCTVTPGQIMRKQVPPEKTKDVLEFATKRPEDRLASIRNGLEVLSYGQSEYVRQFGMQVDESVLKIDARVLKPPTLKYGPNSKQPTIQPFNGSWNMVDKKFFKPCTIDRFVVVVYERRQRFDERTADEMVNGLLRSCQDCGIIVRDKSPLVSWQNGQGRIADQLKSAGMECAQKKGSPPALIVVVLPEGGNDIYTAVKHFGDITMGVATQCLKSQKCFRAKAQYYANVCLKVNVKMGGINSVPDPQSVTVLTDPRNPTIVMGADVIHPAPGADGRPSFTALVANVDSDTAKYIATSRVQTSRQEMIDDLQEMSRYVLDKYMKYRTIVEKKAGSGAPSRIIFYRDGVSEGQFKQVLDIELKALKLACADLKISPKITVIVVGKRHHVRFFPQNGADADKSGNCPAGTVVDREVANPAEFDFYLQSHGGLLGTSRPAHYNILCDENGFTADGLQSLSFALCHVYARSTRSVSIPAPVYYADIVCARAKNHYDPQGSFDFSDSATQADDSQATTTLENFKRGFRPLHQKMATVMYFS